VHRTEPQAREAPAGGQVKKNPSETSRFIRLLLVLAHGQYRDTFPLASKPQSLQAPRLIRKEKRGRALALWHDSLFTKATEQAHKHRLATYHIVEAIEPRLGDI
jgi:hypothetical protein